MIRFNVPTFQRSNVCFCLITIGILFAPLPVFCRTAAGDDSIGFRQPGCLPGFQVSPFFQEQEFEAQWQDVSVRINAPAASGWRSDEPVQLVLFALPNGNTIDWTFGKIRTAADDWHFDIQHIGAQTRFLRALPLPGNLVVAYLATQQKSWPAWKREHADHKILIRAIVDRLLDLFKDSEVRLSLSGHSGGGAFLFGFIDGAAVIPEKVQRISFLDSDYGYDEAAGDKIAAWLAASTGRFLTVLAYNDSVALYQGKPLVSEKGGTWYKSRMMQKRLAADFRFQVEEDTAWIRHRSLDGRIQFLLKKNPHRGIFHTEQVERNGFIHTQVAGTGFEEKGYIYFGSRAYEKFIQSDLAELPAIRWPAQPDSACSGSVFISQVQDLPLAEREARIFSAIAGGNLPAFLRRPVWIAFSAEDARGAEHSILLQAAPDYLAVGSDEDFCRMPMTPATAQNLADRFGASLPTGKLADLIWRQAALKLAPKAYRPLADANERPRQFLRHQNDIEAQLRALGGIPGELTAGIKKDIILSSKIEDPARPDHLTIYGWHRLDGRPIQPETNVHWNYYVDYSHGVRLINRNVLIDGAILEVEKVLQDTVLFKLLSDEPSPMKRVRY